MRTFTSIKTEINKSLNNQYYKAIKRIVEIVNYYDTDSFIPVYGFGAKLPPYFNSVSHWFALNGNMFDPEIDGVSGVWEQYKKMIKKIKFHGPSAMAPMVRFITEYTSFEKNDQNQQHYTILLVCLIFKKIFNNIIML